jgi:malate dehydrogenase
MGVGSAFVSPTWSALEMAEAIILDKKKIMAASTLLQGEYGVKGLFIGVPVVLGARGIERIIEMDLTESEKTAFANSVQSVRKTAEEVIAMTNR